MGSNVLKLCKWLPKGDGKSSRCPGQLNLGSAEHQRTDFGQGNKSWMALSAFCTCTIWFWHSVLEHSGHIHTSWAERRSKIGSAHSSFTCFVTLREGETFGASSAGSPGDLEDRLLILVTSPAGPAGWAQLSVSCVCIARLVSRTVKAQPNHPHLSSLPILTLLVQPHCCNCRQPARWEAAGL